MGLLWASGSYLGPQTGGPGTDCWGAGGWGQGDSLGGHLQGTGLSCIRWPPQDAVQLPVGVGVGELNSARECHWVSYILARSQGGDRKEGPVGPGGQALTRVCPAPSADKLCGCPLARSPESQQQGGPGGGPGGGELLPCAPWRQPCRPPPPGHPAPSQPVQGVRPWGWGRGRHRPHRGSGFWLLDVVFFLFSLAS